MKLAVITFDAGPAEVIAAWILKRRGRLTHLDIFVEGPARRVFSIRWGGENLRSFDEISSCVSREGVDLILTGASWGTSEERRAWMLAKERGIKSAVFLDGWADFGDAFLFEGRPLFPDEVWITHPAIQERILPLGVRSDQVRVEPNFYHDAMVERIQTLRKARREFTEGLRVLYLCENISSAERALHRESPRRGYDEFEALEFFLSQLRARTHPFDAKVSLRVRPHPSETREKYARAVEPGEFSPEGSTLEEDLAWCDLAVGCESNALIIAAKAGRTVYSMIPPHAKILCRIPDERVMRWRGI